MWTEQLPYWAERSQPWATAVGFSAFRGDLLVPPPLVFTVVYSDVGQHCLISSSHFVGVRLEWGHTHASSLSLQASRHPLWAWTLFYHRLQSDQLFQLNVT